MTDVVIRAWVIPKDPDAEEPDEIFIGPFSLDALTNLILASPKIMDHIGVEQQ